MPQGCTWGLFDHSNQKDTLGTLNFLTPPIIRAAAQQIQDGISISLNWPLNALSWLNLHHRKQPTHRILYLPDSMPGVPPSASAWDDELDFNTQSSSQWDSLCHVQHIPSGLAYNGFRPDLTTLSDTPPKETPTLDQWHSRGAMVARGVLLDYEAYARETAITFDPFAGTAISIADLEAAARHFSLDFHPGDVLIIRTGTTEALDRLRHDVGPEDGRASLPLSQGRCSGLLGSEETARWLWNHRFTAVASDSFALEVVPPVLPDGTRGGMEHLVLHQYMLSLMGMPIGELWDLSRLSRHCHQTRRYSFMLTSAPLNHPSLIASPPNAIAIF
ncbi:cyclase protein [Ophiocordyceps camponoti-floridani]|uniref:Cyclase protein n=1 Tax=Ophiocordyceps camponoti-floridani TaxID=2030778 RepID=A0A8H4Q8H8_9HYPO|nr:cyclase protein [Ophiocordyceps camponoti-floridani]